MMKEWLTEVVFDLLDFLVEVVTYGAITYWLFGDFRYGFLIGLVISEIKQEIRHRSV